MTDAAHGPSPLFQPIAVGGRTLSNRVLVSPMCQYAAIDGVAQPWHAMHIGGFAKAGPGAVIMESTAVEARGRISPDDLGLWNDEQEAALARLIADVRTYAATPLGVQLGHAGRKASTQSPWIGNHRSEALADDEGGWPVVGPSALAFDATYREPTALDAAGITLIVQAFAQAAQRAVRAGFDLIELHAGHGYLMSSFISVHSNQRTDDYGGSLENRMRFPLEIVAAVRSALPVGFPLGVRIDVDDWVNDSAAITESPIYARALEAAGASYIAASAGAISPLMRRPSVSPGYMLHLARHIKAAVGIPVVGLGMIVSPQQAADAVAKDEADMVAIARGFLDDPHWVLHAADELGARVKRIGAYGAAAPRAWPGYALAHSR